MKSIRRWRLAENGGEHWRGPGEFHMEAFNSSALLRKPGCLEREWKLCPNGELMRLGMANDEKTRRSLGEPEAR